MNTTNLKRDPLRKALKHAARTRLKKVEAGLTNVQRTKLRRARAEKHIGVRAFLKKETPAT